MALTRRSGQRFEANIWPGFVDAMTALLLVLVFMLSIFMIVQFMLRETITTQDTELDQLAGEVQSLASALGLEQQRGFGLDERVSELDAALLSAQDRAQSQDALIAALSQQTAEQAGQIGSFEEQVAGLLAQRGDLRDQLAAAQVRGAGLETEITTLTQDRDSAREDALGLTARLDEIEAGLAREITGKEAAQLALAQARDEIDAGQEAARLAAARREALLAMVADLKADTNAQATALSAAEEQRLTDAAAAEALRARLENSQAELTAMSLALEDRRRDAEETLSLLAAARASEQEVNDRLIAALAAGEAARNQADASEQDLLARLLIAEQARDDLAQQADDLATQTATGAQTVEALRAELVAALAARRALEQDAARKSIDTAAAQSTLLAQLQTEQSRSETALAEATDLRSELATALAAQRAATAKAGTALTDAEQRAALLATTRSELASEKALSSESQREVEALNQQVASLRTRLGSLQALLDTAASRDDETDVQIETLGAQLNTALAQVAAEQRKVAQEQQKLAQEQRLLAQEQSRRAELEEAERKRLEAETQDLRNYRSEFFGTLKNLLDERDGVRIVGDRFVFSSEVLFDAGQAELSDLGRAEVAKVAELLLGVADDIPQTLDWVIRVDGHTDNVPLSGTGDFVDNWELSQARALSVVRYMSGDLGIPPDRLAANGFGEYQPLNTDSSAQARAQNRRIELKLTEK